MDRQGMPAFALRVKPTCKIKVSFLMSV